MKEGVRGGAKEHEFAVTKYEDGEGVLFCDKAGGGTCQGGRQVRQVLDWNHGLRG